MTAALNGLSAKLSAKGACDWEDVRFLRQLLVSDQQRHARSRSVAPNVQKPSKKIANHSRAKSIAQTTLPSSHQTVQKLTVQQRYRIATEAVNYALSVLGNAVLERDSVFQATHNPKNGPTASAQSTDSCLQDVPHSTKTTYMRPPVHNAEDSSSNISQSLQSTIAELGHIAFEFLLSSEAIDATSNAKSGNGQLVDASLVFAGKLFAQGQFELAERQLRRLHVHLNPSKSSHGIRATGLSSIVVSPQSLASLLVFESINIKDLDRLGYISSFQSLLLRLIANRPSSTTLEDALPLLDISSKCSPINVLLQCARVATLSKRVPAQLESLSKTLIYCSKKVVPDPGQESLVASIVLRLQALSLCSRIAWIAKSDLGGDSYKDITTPFIQSIKEYLNNSVDTPTQKFALVQTLSRELDDFSNKYSRKSVPRIIHDNMLQLLLGYLACEAGHTDEGLEALDDVLSGDSEHILEHDGLYFISVARLGRQSFAISPTSTDPDQSWIYLSSASTLLEHGFTDGGIKIETIVRDAMQLRNAAYDHLRTAIASNVTDDAQSREQVLRCYDVMKHFLLFLLRNLSLQAKDSNSMATRALERRQSVLSRIVQQSIQAVANVTRQVSDLEWFPYSVMLSALHVSELIIRRLQTLQDESDSKMFLGINLESLTAELAKVHFQMIKSGEQSETQITDGINIIRKGLRLLEPLSEGSRRGARQAFGFLRLGRLQSKLSKTANALNSFESCLKACLANDIVAGAAQLARSMPFSAILSRDPDIQVLHSATRAFLEIELKKEQDLKDDWIVNIRDADIRAILLESRLVVFADWTKGYLRRSKAQRIISLTMHQLLDCYDQNEHPLKRRRVNADILRFAMDSQTPVEGVDDEEPADIIKNLAEDVDLEHYNAHICATFNATCGLYRNISGFAHIDRAIEIWLGLVKPMTSWEGIMSHVYDPETWLAQLDSIADFLEMHGRDQQRIRCLALIARVTSNYPQKAAASRAMRLLSVATAIIDLGYPDVGKLWIDSATAILDESHTDSVSHVRRDIAMACWYLAKDDVAKSFKSIAKAKEHLPVANNVTGQSLLAVSTGSFSVKTQEFVFIADTHYLYAVASLRQDHLLDSLTFARRTVTFLSHVWRVLESRHGIEPNDTDDSLAAVDALTRRLSRMSLTPQKARPNKVEVAKILGPSFWPLARRLFRALFHLGRVSKRLGSWGSATIAYDQAQKIADSASAPLLRAQIMAEKADLAWRSGNDEEAKTLYYDAEQLFSQHPESNMFQILGLLSLGDFFRHRRQWRLEIDVYARVESTIDLLESPTFLDEVSLLREIVCKPVSPLATAELAESTAPALHEAQGKRKTKSTKSKHKNDTDRLLSTTTKTHELASPTAHLRYEIHSRKTESMLAQKNLVAAFKFLQKLKEDTKPLGLAHMEEILRATHLLHEALDSMAADAVFSMLPESTLSLPNVPPSSRRSASASQALEQSTNQYTQSKRTSQVVHSTQEDILQNLHLASETLLNIQHELDKWPNSTISRVQELMSACAMLLSFAGSRSSGYRLQPAQLASHLDLYKDVAVAREYMVLEIELANKAAGLSLEWPKQTEPCTIADEAASTDSDLTQMLPDNWSVVSLNLREQDEHLYLTRYTADTAPFVLRLPLNRPTGEDLEEESFSLADAKNELGEIVQESNAMVHMARDAPESMKVKGAKTQWWAERDDLDARLKDLLVNMENIWLGGFRSIFSTPDLTGEGLEKFRDAFESILSRHLPSRQTSSKRSKSQQTALDVNVLGLFTGLMTCQDDGVADLDEALNDLLYFVVDILQYNGEANAYDEIDFDAIIVEVQDALLDYRDSIDDNSAPSSHTKQLMLVLDKELHMFPWESMPCLERRSVSRVPSIRDIVDRIRLMQTQPNRGAMGVTISAQNGTYVLNPGGDLPRTQTYFAKPLSSLKTLNWTELVGRVPSEHEFAAALSQGIDGSARGVMLYIGHGSGAQYIRAKTVRRLRPHCNAALLFGCSSASLKEAGEFEAHGTPKNYLAAGAPAVLGSLWDVTDGDVDKFAGAVLEGWGLLPRGSCKEHAQQQQKGKDKVRGRGKNKSKRPQDETRFKRDDQSMSLSDAVARSRAQCYLRYLNGAAMVVYGVPVYLG